MILAVLLLLICQLIGEVIARMLGLPLPGPVLGLALLLILFIVHKPIFARVQPTAQGLLQHLSLLFVPAGVGIVGHVDRLGTEGFGILMALILSTLLAIAIGALVFAGVSKLCGDTEENLEKGANDE